VAAIRALFVRSGAPIVLRQPRSGVRERLHQTWVSNRASDYQTVGRYTRSIETWGSPLGCGRSADAWICRFLTPRRFHATTV